MISLPSPALTYEVYYVGEPTKTISFVDFTIPDICDDLVWIYVAEDMTSGTPAALPTFITHLNNDFTIYTSDILNIKTLTIRVTATLPNG